MSAVVMIYQEQLRDKHLCADSLGSFILVQMSKHMQQKDFRGLELIAGSVPSVCGSWGIYKDFWKERSKLRSREMM